jgi:DNA-binding Lrp family transcriptional regulator
MHSERLAHPFSALGRSVGLSCNTVYQPVKVFKEHGSITNSYAIIDLDEFGLTLHVLIQMGISYHDVEWWKTILDS